jgi:predicted  nucleic acid-binding Zn-ribbon protein
MTKAEEVFTRVEQLVAEGTTKADAFKQLATEYGQPVNSVRGSYYQHSRRAQGEAGTPSRPRRRETTPEDALADARAALERAIEAVDREVATAKDRADEARREYDALKASATERKQAIQERLEALR